MAENLTPKKYIDSNNMKQILTAIKDKTPVGDEYVTEEQLLAKDYATKAYVGEQIVNAEHLKREIVTVLPSDTEASDNIIYMLKVESATGNDKYQEYMKIDGTVQMVGDTSVDLADYAKTVDIPTTVAELTDSADYAKTADVNDSISTLQTDKANASDLTAHTDDADIHVTAENKTLWNTVDGKVDKTDILTAKSDTATDEQVYSAKAINTELDGIVKKTDVSTTIDSTSTNDTVPTNKAVYDSLINKVDKTVILNTADEVNSFDRTYQSFVIPSTVAIAVGLPNTPNSTWFCINLSHIKGFKYPSQIAFEYAGARKIMYRVADNGVWSTWRKIPNTSVADVPVTTITNNLVSTKVAFQAPDSNAYLYVKNGTCYVSMWNVTILEEASLEVLFNNAPKSAFMVVCALHNGYESFGHVFITTNSTEIRLNASSRLVGKSGYCSFSYPVAES